MRRHCTVLIAIALALVGCTEDRKSKSKAEQEEEKKQNEAGAEAGEAYGDDPGYDDPGSFGSGSSSTGGGGGQGQVMVGSVDFWNGDASNYPTGLDGAPLKGSPLPHASKAGSSRHPKNNWTSLRASSGAGSFILAGSSVATGTGGDIVRRIDFVDGQPVEKDFNPRLPGTQGLHIMVPPNLRGDWEKGDFSGDGMFIGTMCGFVPGPDEQIIAFAGRGAFLLDPYAEGEGGAIEPLATIVFPTGTRVCDGVYSPQWQKVYGFEVESIFAASKNGIFVANVPPRGEVSTAGLFKVNVKRDYGITKTSRNTFQDGDLYDNVLYLTEGAGRTGGSDEDVVVHRVPLNDQGEPLFEHATQFATGNPLTRASGCASHNPDYTAGALVVEVGGTPTLLVGGTSGVTAWDISSETPKKIDLDPRAGTQPLHLGETFGQGAPEIHLAPEGKSVYVMPFCHSTGKVRLESSDPAIAHGTFDHFYRRLAVLDTEASSLDEGVGAVDIGYHWFQNKLAQEIAALRMPNFKMDFRDMAVGREHIVVIGYGSRGNTGLGPGGDVIIAERKNNKVMVFAEPGDRPQEQLYGFRLAKDDPDVRGGTQSVYGVLWVP